MPSVISDTFIIPFCYVLTTIVTASGYEGIMIAPKREQNRVTQRAYKTQMLMRRWRAKADKNAYAA